MKTLTPEMLSKATGCTVDVATTYSPYLITMLPAFGITTPNRVAAFLSQTAHETGGYRLLSENLNYSAEGLSRTWPIRYAVKGSDGKSIPGKPNALALRLNRSPEKIANNCYANRMGNGDEASGDGYRYRGRGLKQLTGKFNYQKFKDATGMDVIHNPDLLTEPMGAILSALNFWKQNKLETYADKADIVGLTKAINGGTIGLAQRQALYDKVLKWIS